MSIIKRALFVLGVCLGCNAAQAVVITGGLAEFDDALDLLHLSGTVSSTNNGTFNEFAFDWDGPLNGFNFGGSSLLSSNLGGFLAFPAGSLPSGAFAIAGLTGAPFSAPLFFDFLISIPGAGADFLTQLIDVGLCDDCTPGYVGGEVQDDVLSPVAANFQAVPEPPALALVGIGLVGLGFIRRNRNTSK